MNFQKYKNQAPYPTKTNEAIKTKRIELKDDGYNLNHPKVMAQLDELKLIHRLEIKNWKDETARLERVVFKEDLAEYLDLVGHEKYNLLFDMAWDHSRSDGLQAIADYALDLANLVTPYR